MNDEEQDYFQELAGSAPGTLGTRFRVISQQLALHQAFSRNEWTLLGEAALRAALCSSALNGRDGYGPALHPEHELRRRSLEIAFLEARDMLFASPGWQSLGSGTQDQIISGVLTVYVDEDQLSR
jgi:hypothetical protein